MENSNNKRVKHTFKYIISICLLIITVAEAIFSSIKSGAYSVSQEEGIKSTLYYVLLGLTISSAILILFFLEHGKGIDLIFKYFGKLNKDKYAGKWHLTIEHDPIKGVKKPPVHGTFIIQDSVSGRMIDGQEITNTETGEVVVEDWVAEKVEIREYVDKVIMIYTYITYADKEKTQLKIGVSSLEAKIGSNQFKGRFHDFGILNKDEHLVLREGSVTLTQIDNLR